MTLGIADQEKYLDLSGLENLIWFMKESQEKPLRLSPTVQPSLKHLLQMVLVLVETSYCADQCWMWIFPEKSVFLLDIIIDVCLQLLYALTLGVATQFNHLFPIYQLKNLTGSLPYEYIK